MMAKRGGGRRREGSLKDSLTVAVGDGRGCAVAVTPTVSLRPLPSPTDRTAQLASTNTTTPGMILAPMTPPTTKGTAIVSCTDGSQTWHVRLAPGVVPEVRLAARDEQADARLSNRTANVLYQLWSRMQLTGSGDPAVLRALRMS